MMMMMMMMMIIIIIIILLLFAFLDSILTPGIIITFDILIFLMIPQTSLRNQTP